MKGEYDRAISDYSKTIELKPERVDSWEKRGSIYLFNKGDYEKAREDYEKVTTLSDDPSVYSILYLIDRIDNFDKKVVKKIVALYRKVMNIKSTLLIRVIKGNVVHYCSLNTLKKLATGEKFRLYNVDYMNDPEEGKTFFDLINESNFNVNEIFLEEKKQKNLFPRHILAVS